MSTSLNLKPVGKSSASSTSSRTHPQPSCATINDVSPPWQALYATSKDGKEANLLIMFHGLGDTKEPFFKLAQQMNLPATCILSLQGQSPVPFMDTPSWSWYPVYSSSFPHLPLDNPSPYPPIESLCALLRYLTSAGGCKWNLEQIHLFGWGQGGTMALELARWVGLNGLDSKQMPKEPAGGQSSARRLGSAVSICGPLLSIPSISAKPLAIQTPVAYFHRSRTTVSLSALQKTFATLRPLEGKRDPRRLNEAGEDEGMLTGQEEWMPVMKFWSQVLGRADESWKGGEEVYEVIR